MVYDNMRMKTNKEGKMEISNEIGGKIDIRYLHRCGAIAMR